MYLNVKCCKHQTVQYIYTHFLSQFAYDKVISQPTNCRFHNIFIVPAELTIVCSDASELFTVARLLDTRPNNMPQLLLV